MARYVLKIGNQYVSYVRPDDYVLTDKSINNAKVYSDSMLEQDRIKIAKQVKKQFKTVVEVIRIL